MTDDAQDPTTERSIMQQILDEMFVELANQSDFDSDLLEQLRQLADAGQLKKPTAVSEAIRAVARRAL